MTGLGHLPPCWCQYLAIRLVHVSLYIWIHFKKVSADRSDIPGLRLSHARRLWGLRCWFGLHESVPRVFVLSSGLAFYHNSALFRRNSLCPRDFGHGTLFNYRLRWLVWTVLQYYIAFNYFWWYQREGDGWEGGVVRGYGLWLDIHTHHSFTHRDAIIRIHVCFIRS